MNELKMTAGKLGKAESEERRAHQRFLLTVTVEAVDLNSQTHIHGRTCDLSCGGCFVDAISSFPVGSVLSIRLTKEDRSFETLGEVVYSLSGMGMGVKFNNTGANQLGIIGRWIGTLNGEQESKPNSQPEQCDSREGSKPEELQVLAQLVMELMRNGTLPNANGRKMLKKLGLGEQETLNSPIDLRQIDAVLSVSREL